MELYHSIGLVIVFGLCACANSPSFASFLAGEWVPQSAEMGGKPYPVSAFGGASLNLTTDSYEFAGDKGSYLTDPQATPATMDIHGMDGPNAGKHFKAIYRLENDQLTVCYQLGEGERPTKFESPPDTQVLLVRYKKKV